MQKADHQTTRSFKPTKAELARVIYLASQCEAEMRLAAEPEVGRFGAAGPCNYSDFAFRLSASVAARSNGGDA